MLALALAGLYACGDSGPGPGRGDGASGAHPSIVFLSIDTLGAGSTSLHGYARDTTPHLAALAAESVVLDRCLANAPFTGPSYVSQFTGVLPRCSAIDREEFRALHGRAPRAWEILRVPEERQTLTELLRAAGYRTAAFVDNPQLRPALGIAQGFEVYDTTAAEITARDPEGGIRALVPRALAWLDGLGPDEPFFLFVNALDPHEPYLPPPEFKDRFADDPHGPPDLELPVGEGGFAVVDISDVRDYFEKPPYPERMRTAPIAARYDEEVRAVDEALGGLFAELRRRGRLDGAILIVTADHGEALSQPDYKFGHGTHVEQVLHVPFLMRLPGGARGGTRSAAPVQLLDLYPTLAELAGLRPPEGLQGRSLVPLFAGQALEPRPFFHENGRLASTSVTEGEWRLVVTSPGARVQCVLTARGRTWLGEHYPDLGPDYFLKSMGAALASGPRAKHAMAEARAALRGPFAELYHLPSDPHLLHDVSADHPEIVARLQAHLKASQERTALERSRLPVKPDPVLPEVDLEELRGLGYVGDDDEELERSE